MTPNNRVHVFKKDKKEKLQEYGYFSGILKLNVLLKLLYFKMTKELLVNVIIMKRCSCWYGN